MINIISLHCGGGISIISPDRYLKVCTRVRTFANVAYSESMKRQAHFYLYHVTLEQKACIRILWFLECMTKKGPYLHIRSFENLPQ